MPAQRILVADDEPRLLHIVSMYLDMEGYEVIAAEDGEAAAREVEAGGFDLALLDVMMPGLDGFEVCRLIRASPLVSQVPVLLFTALSSDTDAELGRQAGATHMITKPFSLPGLAAVLQSCFAHSDEAAAI